MTRLLERVKEGEILMLKGLVDSLVDQQVVVILVWRGRDTWVRLLILISGAGVSFRGLQ